MHLVLLAFLTSFVITSPGWTAQYVDVNWSGTESGTTTAPFSSIRAGVGAASSGETIIIADGTYSDSVENFSAAGHINIPSGLTLEAGYVGHTGGSTFDWTTRTPRTTTIDLASAGNNRAFFSDSQATPTLDGFTFQNANNSLDGGAVWLGDSFSQGGVVRNSLFQNNVTTGSGGAIRFEGNNDQSILENVDFLNNQAAHGGALEISVPGDQNVQFTDVLFDANTATGTGGAIRVLGGAKVNVSSAQFTGNSANDGGAINNSRGTVVLKQTSIVGNTAAGESAINAWGFQDVNVLLENVLIANNISTGGGYAVEVGSNRDGELTANFVTVADNAGAGAIYVHEKGSAQDEVLNLTNSIIDGTGTGTGINTDIGSAGVLNLNYNDVYDFGTLYGGTATAGGNSLSTDPQFYDAATNSYQLAPTSPLLGAADPSSTLGFDLIGDSRPLGDGYTMGAFEASLPEPGMMIFLMTCVLTLYCRRPRQGSRTNS